MTTHPCMEASCGRIHGTTGPYSLCALHATEFRAGVEVRLSTGYVIALDHDGRVFVRAPRADDAAPGTLGAAGAPIAAKTTQDTEALLAGAVEAT